MTALPVAACPDRGRARVRPPDRRARHDRPARARSTWPRAASARRWSRCATCCRRSEPDGTGIPFVVVVPAPARRAGAGVGAHRRRRGLHDDGGRRPGALPPAAGARRPDRARTCSLDVDPGADTLERAARPRCCPGSTRRRPVAAHDRRGAGRARLRPGRAAGPQLLLAARARGRGTSGCRRCGSAPGGRGWAGATRARRTPGSGRPPAPAGWGEPPLRLTRGHAPGERVPSSHVPE